MEQVVLRFTVWVTSLACQHQFTLAVSPCQAFPALSVLEQRNTRSPALCHTNDTYHQDEVKTNLYLTTLLNAPIYCFSAESCNFGVEVCGYFYRPYSMKFTENVLYHDRIAKPKHREGTRERDRRGGRNERQIRYVCIVSISSCQSALGKISMDNTVIMRPGPVIG